jgi:hypothetical protein
VLIDGAESPLNRIETFADDPEIAGLCIDIGDR